MEEYVIRVGESHFIKDVKEGFIHVTMKVKEAKKFSNYIFATDAIVTVRELVNNENKLKIEKLC